MVLQCKIIFHITGGTKLYGADIHIFLVKKLVGLVVTQTW